MTYQPDSNAIADYLSDNPHFFEEHSELLAKVKLTSPLAGRTVSLQERQMEVLRDKIKALELRLMELMRIGQENDDITQKFQLWTRSLLLARNDVDLPHALINGLQTIFAVPHVTLRIWGVSEEFSHTWFAADVSADARIFCNGLTAPFCGQNNDFEAASWFDEGASVQSLAMLPLRTGAEQEAFGLLVLGSPEAGRFTPDMGTDFLTKIADTAGAALTCLLV
ncbi:DUF484 family protein [Noviherbaspirillum cavernae]|uniref:DUF484 family protein n=1 Tax=Noviherbaspirillum cavernae TaxID=2320862 RepID=A0A418WXS0_9BURK|nr:DUF484 family protein [Noviherbaspirillum cavernae]RJG04923.1 DUF484 family protein [Noviherbaspirillum cavernae]